MAFEIEKEKRNSELISCPIEEIKEGIESLNDNKCEKNLQEAGYSLYNRGLSTEKEGLFSTEGLQENLKIQTPQYSITQIPQTPTMAYGISQPSYYEGLAMIGTNALQV